MPVRVMGEVLGHLSSSFRVISTLLGLDNLVMVEGCGMRTLKLL